jgi:trigger factor
MQVTETNADGLKREFTIVIPAGEVEDQISTRLTQLSKQIRLPGFRPGKVPQSLLRQRYGSAIRGEVLEHAVQETSSETMRERNLRPALQPKVEIVAAPEGGDFEYKMSVEVLPDIPQPEFDGLELERLAVDVPDEDVDKAVERMAEQFRKSEPVARAAQNGDILVIDVVGKVGDQEIPGTKGEERQVELGAEGQLPGFTEQLLGVSAGDTRQVKTTLPDDYGNPDFAGKEAVFDVTAKEVRERQPAKIDDSLAEEVGLENLAELRQEIRERIARDYGTVTRQRMKRQLLDKLAERYEFPVPPGMIEIEFNNIWQQHQTEKAYTAAAAQPAGETPAEPEPAAGGEPPADTAAEMPSPPQDSEEDEKLKAEFRSLAERRVRLGLLLAEVGRNANISVTQEELNQALIREAQRFPGAERRVLDYYRNNPEAAGNLRAPIFEEKVVDYIVELAKPAERKISPQDLLALSEADEADDGDEASAEEKPAAKKPRRQSGARSTAKRSRKGEQE